MNKSDLGLKNFTQKNEFIGTYFVSCSNIILNTNKCEKRYQKMDFMFMMH